MAWYKKNMLFKKPMSNVDENVNENNSSGKDPITSNEPNEDEVEHGPFKFLHDDEIPFSRLLSYPTIWQIQGSDNGDAMPIHEI
jgi:hypothetical protein